MEVHFSVLFLVAIAVSSSAQVRNDCMIQHCSGEAAACYRDPVCQVITNCVDVCILEFGADPTPQKIKVQNCTGVCTNSYMDEAYTDFIICMTSNDCIKVPSIPDPCRRNTLAIGKKVPLIDFKGSWWVIRGYHPIYDCYPCQNFSFAPNNSTTWSFRARYKVYLLNGSVGPTESSGLITTTTDDEGGYAVSVEVAGMPSDETWWVIDMAEDASYVLVYYCAKSLQWYSEGALVLAKNPTLPDKAVSDITASFKTAVGLDFANFCTPDLTNC